MLKEDSVVGNCGFVVSPKWPWLGCSPDGIITKDDIVVGYLEVKCPYASNDLDICEASQNNKQFFLNKNMVEGLRNIMPTTTSAKVWQMFST